MQREREALETKVAYSNQLQSVKKAFRKIFDMYSSLNSSYGFLKNSQFKEILQNSKIVPYKISLEELEIVYSRNKRKGDPYLVFETFLMALISIAKTLQPDLPPMEAL